MLIATGINSVYVRAYMAKSNTITEHSNVLVVIHLANIFNKSMFNTSYHAKCMHSYYNIIIVHDVYLWYRESDMPYTAYR